MSFHFVLTGDARYARSDMIQIASDCGGQFHETIRKARKKQSLDNNPILLVCGRQKGALGGEHHKSAKIIEAEKADKFVSIVTDKEFLARTDIKEAVSRLLSKVCVVLLIPLKPTPDATVLAHNLAPS